jgi:lysophospholipase L1-like esterase
VGLVPEGKPGTHARRRGRNGRWASARRVRAVNAAVNAGIACCAVLATVGLFEFVVFRAVLPAPDLPRLVFRDGIVRYAPNQHGISRLRDESTSPWLVNADGWTSSLPDYEEAKAAGTYRIVVIGDSYIEGMHVGPTENVAEQLQRALRNPSVEVYRFGIGGAPLSQYLHMLRREVCRYQPDLVIVNLVHNDFRESYTAFATAPGASVARESRSSSFLKLELHDGVVREVEPHGLVQPWYEPVLSRAATWRYLAGRYQLRHRLFHWPVAKRILSHGHTDQRAIRETRPPRDAERIATEYVIPKLRDRAARCGARLALVIDGDREAIYARQAAPSARLKLNAIVRTVAQRQHVAFLDLHDVFRRDFLEHGQTLNFSADPHWNQRAHAIAARAIKTLLFDKALVPRTFSAR